MKHSPITLGFAAFSALTVMTACNPEPNRIDKDATKNLQIDRCKGGLGINTEVLNEDRKTKLANLNESQVVTKTTIGGNTQIHGKSKPDSNDSNAISIVGVKCQELTAGLILPGVGRIDNLSITEILGHSMTMENDTATYTVSVEGVDVLTPEVAASEDGINNIIVTETSKNGGAKVTYESESVATANTEVKTMVDGQVVPKAVSAIETIEVSEAVEAVVTDDQE